MCENHLKNLSLNIPKQKVMVFTGLSGSGKSSRIFDDVAAAVQRKWTASTRGKVGRS